MLFALSVISCKSCLLVFLRKRFMAVFQEALLVTAFLPFINNPQRGVLVCFFFFNELQKTIRKVIFLGFCYILFHLK